MALTNVQGFLASDGKFFFKDQGQAASVYEAELQFKAWCRLNICVGGEWSSDMVSKAILEYWTVNMRNP
jgi:hypothetical protein